MRVKHSYMDNRQALHSSYSLPPDDLGGLSRARQPLTNSAGNAQLHNLASAQSALYYDNKAHQSRIERSIYQIPTVPSQPPRQSVGSALELRRQNIRKQRQTRHNENPITESHQYQAYRERQEREGVADDAKWPPLLEDAFLDGM